MAMVHFARRDPEVAAQHFLVAVEADPENVSALVYLSMLYGQLHRHRGAVAWAARALELDPENIDAIELFHLYSRSAQQQPDAGDQQ